MYTVFTFIYVRQSSIIPPDVFAVHDFGGSGHTPWPLVFAAFSVTRSASSDASCERTRNMQGIPARCSHPKKWYSYRCWYVTCGMYCIYLLATIIVWHVYIYIHTYWYIILSLCIDYVSWCFTLSYMLTYSKHTVTFTFLQASRHPNSTFNI